MTSKMLHFWAKKSFPKDYSNEVIEDILLNNNILQYFYLFILCLLSIVCSIPRRSSLSSFIRLYLLPATLFATGYVTIFSVSDLVKSFLNLLVIFFGATTIYNVFNIICSIFYLFTFNNEGVGFVRSRIHPVLFYPLILALFGVLLLPCAISIYGFKKSSKYLNLYQQPTKNLNIHQILIPFILCSLCYMLNLSKPNFLVSLFFNFFTGFFAFCEFLRWSSNWLEIGNFGTTAARSVRTGMFFIARWSTRLQFRR